MTEAEESPSLLLELTSEIVSSHVANNAVAAADLPDLIRAVHSTLSRVGQAPEERSREPAVPVTKSVSKGSIACLECGRHFKALKRHLWTAHGQTPEEYRARWGLRHDYPMVAPEYAARRQELAKEIGLGRSHRGKRRGKRAGKRDG